MNEDYYYAKYIKYKNKLNKLNILKNKKLNNRLVTNKQLGGDFQNHSITTFDPIVSREKSRFDEPFFETFVTSDLPYFQQPENNTFQVSETSYYN